ncbi:steroid receptor RNA activator 1-like [Ochlerotatus camptorhynchus]|uniref:steroid receptor RNA activator 1-like n=1 Tax=Ochlerotatus camptorhynchus TaxID=644619 RepID=UPI0031DF436C
MSAENYRSATKSHDPGWNDPPKLSYSPGVVTGQTPKLNLNKRIAFPVAGTTAVNQPPPVPGAAAIGSSLPQFVPAASSGPPMAGPPRSVNPSAPPMLTVGTPPRVGQIDKPSSNAVDDTLVYPKDDEMRDFVKGILGDFLLKTDSTRQAEIRKRLDLMQESWNDGKLSDGLTRKLYRLAFALNEGRVSDANDGHRSIIVEHGKECVQWAPALRQLIQAVPTPAEMVTEATEGDEKEAITKPL